MEHIVNTLLHTCVYTQEIFSDCWCATPLKIIEIDLASLSIIFLFILFKNNLYYVRIQLPYLLFKNGIKFRKLESVMEGNLIFPDHRVTFTRA